MVSDRMSGVQSKFLWGAGVVDGGNSERCLSGVVGSLRNLSRDSLKWDG